MAQDDAVAKAASALAGAEKKFPGSMAKAAGVKPASERMAKPNASAAKSSESTSKPAASAPSINSRGGQIEANKDILDYSPTKFHRGGKIKKDGVQVINAQKDETVLPNKNKKRATELAMKHLDGMEEGMKHAAKKHAKPSHGGKKHGKVKKMHVHVNDDNTFSMTHEHHPMEDGTGVPDTTHSAPDMDGLIDHMQEHLGTPNPGEAEASAPAPASGGAPAV